MGETASGGSRIPAVPGGRERMGLAQLAWRVSQALSGAERRALALRLLEAEAEEITFRRDGTRWTAFPWDYAISGPLFVSGGFQGREVRAVLAWMTRRGRLGGPRDVIVDVGANIGTSAIPFARGTACRVLAIEPVPDVFAVLRRNVADNSLERRVTCVQAAISAGGRDRVRMVVPAGNGGGGEIERPGRPPTFAPRHPVRSVVEVPASGLADLLDAHGVAAERVAFVWSDTQGCEVEVIESAGPLWAAGVPLFAELDPSTWGPAGATAILSAAARHFGGFVSAEALIGDDTAKPRPMAELAALCHALGPDGGDVLLLPEAPPLRQGARRATRV
jgi:FkbM family methyltransferase